MQLEAWGTTHDLCVEAGQYSVGESLALQLYVNEEYGLEPYASLTVNLPSQHCAPDCAFVDINGLQDAEKMILQYGIGEPTGRTAVSGFCTYPEYRFDMDKLKDFCLNPKDLPEKEDIDRAAEKNEKTQEGWSR